MDILKYIVCLIIAAIIYFIVGLIAWNIVCSWVDISSCTLVEISNYRMISAIGVRNVVENKVDLTKSRNLIIAGVIFVCGLGFGNGLTFTVAGTSITLTALAIAAIAGIFLNAILPGNDYEFGKNPDGDASRGVYMMNTDNDEEEES